MFADTRGKEGAGSAIGRRRCQGKHAPIADLTSRKIMKTVAVPAIPVPLLLVVERQSLRDLIFWTLRDHFVGESAWPIAR